MQQDTINNIQVKTAKTISVIFYPLFIPLYGLIVIFTAPTLFWYLPFKIKEILFFIFLINNVLIPVSLIPIIKHRFEVSNPALVEKRKARNIPLLAISILYSITSFIMFGLRIPVFLKAYSYSITILAIILFLVNLRWKMSLYTAGAGALIALVLVLSLEMSSGLPWLLISALLISGFILSARLKLNAHCQSEVYLGFLTGFAVPGLFMLILH